MFPSRLLLVLGLIVIAASSPKAADLATTKALSYIPADATGMMTLDLKLIANHPKLQSVFQELSGPGQPLGKELGERYGVKMDDLERVSIVGMVEPTRKTGTMYFICTTKKPYDRLGIIRKLQLQAGEELANPNKVKYFAAPGSSIGYVFLDEQNLVIALNNTVGAPSPAGLFLNAREEGPLAAAIKLGATSAMAMAVNMNEIRAMAPRDGVPEPILMLLRADLATGTIQTKDDDLLLKIDANFAGKRWTDDAAEVLGSLRKLAVTFLKESETAPNADKDFIPLSRAITEMLNGATLKQTEKTLSLSSNLSLTPELIAGLGFFPKKTMQASDRARSSNNLKQIGLALHNYHDSYGTFPTDVLDPKTGEPILSWRVKVLPFMEETNVFRQVKMDEAWDSPNNKKLIEMMPKTYSLPGANAAKGMTHYQSFRSLKKSPFQAFLVEGDKKGGGFNRITDGSSNTIFCLEAAEPIIWTKPDVLILTEKGDLPKLGGRFSDGFNAAFMDGSVRFISKSVKTETLRAYLTTNGGEIIQE